MADRELSQHLRELGLAPSAPAPMGKRDRSRFLAKLDELVHAIRRQGR